MSDKPPDLSSRYYVAEAAVWVLGAILMVARFIGVPPEQSVPFLDVTLANSEHFPRVLAALLAAAALYQLIEWKQTPLIVRQVHLRTARAGTTLIWAALCFWLSAPVLFAGTAFASVSPAWFLLYGILGLIIGTCTAQLATAALMIRSPTEAQRLHLPRVPVATRAQFVVFAPALGLLIVSFHAASRLSPAALDDGSVVLVLLGFFAAIVSQITYLYFGRDAHGSRVPHTRQLARLREIHEAHDYAYLLNAHESSLPASVLRALKMPPRQVQEFMRRRYSSRAQLRTPVRFRVETQEQIELSLERPDSGWVVRIQKHAGKPGVLQVRVVPEDRKLNPRDIEVPLVAIEAAAEEYLAAHSEPTGVSNTDLTSNALNLAVSSVMIGAAARNGLHNAAMMGLEAEVRMLLEHGADANARRAGGWTPLLLASAQGHPHVARQLLDAGANPNVGNVHKITPLMYAARYGNEEICALLLEYGADPNLQDVYGDAALMVATRFGQVGIAKRLIEAGTDATVRNVRGQCALDLAHEHGQGAIAKVLRKPTSGGRFQRRAKL